MGRDGAGYRLLMPVAAPTGDIAPDCRHYRGDRPCVHNRLCAGCGHYEPYQQRVCVIKLGALGDVIRTLCILPELRQRYPQAHVTWISLPAGCRMIQGHPLIDRVLGFDMMTRLVLEQEQFDLLICLDKEPEPCALAMALFARKKLGVGLSGFGKPVPLNAEAHDYFLLGLSDELKFERNQKSYPRLVYEALGWTYRGQRYALPRDEALVDRMKLKLAGLGWQPGRPTLGINVGAGQAFANKMWPTERVIKLIHELHAAQPALQVLLLGGSAERPAIDTIRYALTSTGGDEGAVIDPGTEHDEPMFAALVDACGVVFCGDTMAMHVAIALEKQVVVVFGPTCAQEIELFGRGEKLVANVACAPCYTRVCTHDNVCVQARSTTEAAAAIGRAFKRLAAGAHALPVLPPAPVRQAG